MQLNMPQASFLYIALVCLLSVFAQCVLADAEIEAMISKMRYWHPCVAVTKDHTVA